MNSFSAQIGIDTSLDETDHDGEPRSRAVMVESSNGAVCITGPFDGWMGYQTLAEGLAEDEADALARKIAANPAAELPALGYDIRGWFQAA